LKIILALDCNRSANLGAGCARGFGLADALE